MWELASGIDALYMSVTGNVPARLLQRLEDARAMAEEAETPLEIEFGGACMKVHPRGLGKYRFRVEDAFGVIQVSPRLKLPPIRVQPRSEFLHRVGPVRAVNYYRSIIGPEVGPVVLRASRLDLYVDIQGWQVDIGQRHRFVKRARKVSTHEEGEEFNGISFGSRKTNTFYARIYNKSAEMRQKGNHYVEQTWNADYVPDLPVIRTEFQVGRGGLKECGIDTIEEAIALSPDLWHLLTRDIVSYRAECPDSNRSRWPYSPEWIVVQNAGLGSNAIGIERMRQDQTAASLKTIAPAITGYCASVGALTGGTSVQDTLREVGKLLEQYESVSGKSFSARVSEKLGRTSIVIPESLQ